MSAVHCGGPDRRRIRRWRATVTLKSRPRSQMPLSRLPAMIRLTVAEVSYPAKQPPAWEQVLKLMRQSAKGHIRPAHTATDPITEALKGIQHRTRPESQRPRAWSVRCRLWRMKAGTCEVPCKRRHPSRSRLCSRNRSSEVRPSEAERSRASSALSLILSACL